MAVAVKNVPETERVRAQNRLAMDSLVGTLYVLAAAAVLIYGLPNLWAAAVTPWFSATIGATVDKAFLFLAELGALVGLVVLGKRLLGSAPPHGVKAGIFLGLLTLFVVAVLSQWVGWLLESIFYANRLFNRSVGLGIMAGVAVALLIVMVRVLFRPKSEKTLVAIEDQGWFNSGAYKRSQGQRVRRGTILGILILAGCGIYTLVNHHTLETGPADWRLSIPFTGSIAVTDAGDTAVLKGSAISSGDTVQVVEKGSSRFEREQIVSRAEYQAEVSRLSEAGKRLPVGGPMVDRFELRDLNQALAQNFVRVAEPGASSLKEGDVVAKPEFDKEVSRLKEEDKAAPSWTTPKPASGPTDYKSVKLLPDVRFTLPILLVGLSLWFAYRLVNFPPFADFLIATEAELNKVSWTTRRRLVQDTIVVLTTVLLLTVFLFTVDVIWAGFLSNKYIQVIQTDASSSREDASREQVDY